MQKLILFDIDGTILHTHGLGRSAVERALGELLDRPVDTAGVSFSGKTDPQIIREVLLKEGLGEDRAAAVLPDLLRRYEQIMAETMRPERITLLPGVTDLIAQLHDDADVQLAVLTGNLAPMAHLKLDAVGLAQYFPFGAFGSDSPHRDDLPAIAIDRAYAYTGRRFNGKDVIVIGDTEHDIRCGLGAGALCVGVCTGHFTREDLEPHGAHVIFEDLSDYAAFRSQVLDV